MSQQAQRLYEFGPYRLNPAQQLLIHGNDKIPLTPKAFRTLLVLVEAQGQIVGKDELLQKVWPGIFVEEATLAQNIFTIRKLLQDDPEKAIYIETVPKRGYRFTAEVRKSLVPAATDPTLTAKTQQTALAPAQSLNWKIRLAVTITAVLVLVLVLALVVRQWIVHSGSASTRATSTRMILAVLPVENLTGDASQEYLTDGLTEEVIADLGGANPQRLGVIARTSAMVYKRTKKTVQQIAGELGADYVLESSLRESSGQVRFTAQLIRTQDQTHIWAKNYDRAKTDVLALQGELAKAVAEQIRIELPAQTVARLSSPRPVQPQAYDAYLKGRFFWNKRTVAAMTIAQTYFRQAIQTDPNFAPAYAGLADCYQVMVNLEQIKAAEGYELARTAAHSALELDDSLADAHTSLASIKGDFDWDWPGAEAEYKRALELNPNYATAHHWYAEFLSGMGRIDEATSEIKKALEIDPLSPVIAVSLGQMYCRAGRCQQGIDQIRKTLELYPDFEEAREALAEIYAHLGMYDAALAEFKKVGQPPEGHPDFLIGYAAAKSGRKEEALNVLHRFETEPSLHHRDYYSAILYSALGDKDQAFARLENARRNHDVFMAYFRADFELNNLRSDRRYAELLARMNMPHTHPSPE